MKFLVHLLPVAAFLFFAGCFEEPKPPYQPKALEDKAKGITIAKGIPYNCIILGEVEGKDSIGYTSGASKEKLRESALNDLKNEASYVARDSKRVMISITNESVSCALRGRATTTDVNCVEGSPNIIVAAYRIHAQVFDCGEK